MNSDTLTLSQSFLAFGLLTAYWYLLAMAKGGNPSAGGQVLAGFLAMWLLYLMMGFGLTPAICFALPMAFGAWYMAYKQYQTTGRRS